MNQQANKLGSFKKAVQIFSFTSLLFALGACGTAGPVKGNVNEYINSLPSWQEVSPLEAENNGEAITEASESEEKLVDDQVYSCQTQSYSLTKNPEQIVMFDPNAGIIWPGALIQGKSHLKGSLQLLALDKSRRAPLGLFVKGGGVLGIEKGISTIVEQPIGSTVNESINQLIVNAHDSDVAVGAGYSQLKSEESFSGTQASLALGLSGRYLGAEASAELNYERDASQYTYTAYFVQRLYTMAIDQPESPSAFFSDSTTAAELEAFGINSENLPLYVSSVSYGRILMYSITSSEERKKIEAAVEFSYDKPVGGVDGYTEAELEQTLKNASIEVLAIGGPNAGVQGLIRDGNLKAYFDEEIELNQVEPISFILRNLGDNSLAKVSNTTEYDVQTCKAVGVKAGEIESNFDENTEGWTFWGDGFNLGNANASWSEGSKDGLVGGYVFVKDAEELGIWYFEAPDVYTGDKSAYYGAELSFQRRIVGKVDISGAADVLLIANNGQALYALLPQPISGGWTRYSINLDEAAGKDATNWINAATRQAATEKEIRAVLTDLGELRIRGEYTFGSDWAAIDSVRLIPTKEQ